MKGSFLADSLLFMSQFLSNFYHLRLIYLLRLRQQLIFSYLNSMIRDHFLLLFGHVFFSLRLWIAQRHLPSFRFLRVLVYLYHWLLLHEIVCQLPCRQLSRLGCHWHRCQKLLRSMEFLARLEEYLLKKIFLDDGYLLLIIFLPHEPKLGHQVDYLHKL